VYSFLAASSPHLWFEIAYKGQNPTKLSLWVFPSPLEQQNLRVLRRDGQIQGNEVLQGQPTFPGKVEGQLEPRIGHVQIGVEACRDFRLTEKNG